MEEKLLTVLDKIESPLSLKELAFRSIKLAIISNKLQAGKLYTQQGIAREVGFSKTPVREALLDLAYQGFIEVISRKGFKVRSLTAKEIQDLYNVRIALEAMVMRSIVNIMTSEHFRYIEGLQELERKTLNDHNNYGYIAIDRELHLYMIKITGNNYLMKAYENIRDIVDWMGLKALIKPERLAEVMREHEKIISCLKEKDGHGAEIAMEEHIVMTRENVIRQMRPPK